MHEYGFDLNEFNQDEIDAGMGMLKIKKAPIGDIKKLRN